MEDLLRGRLAAAGRRPIVLGICGAQGSGKSTLAAALEQRLTASSLRAATLSLDDLYLTLEERRALAATTHALFRTRGVPGTHNVALGHAIMDGLARGEPTALPRFDKAADTRLTPAEWPVVTGGLDVLLFEGWCVGAAPEEAAALATPINDLERDSDPEGHWRESVNAALREPYRLLFDRIDTLVLLAAPDFDVVTAWRIEQEISARQANEDTWHRSGGGMSDAEIAIFVLYFERITRHILREMPARADLVIRLDEQRRVLAAGASAFAPVNWAEPKAAK